MSLYESEPPLNYITYVIQPGDTLSKIALRYETTCRILEDLNGFSASRPILAGQTLRIPEAFEG